MGNKSHNKVWFGCMFNDNFNKLLITYWAKVFSTEVSTKLKVELKYSAVDREIKELLLKS